ncbi:MAG: 50S ribosomal protein L9 [Coriobacteriia bacterium]|nr:50S ribosomal protein L9 [Coriobacteriia bacterium]
MKVILLQEIKGRGGEGDVIEVKRGYAVNYLFPQKMAIEASKGNLKQLELRKHNIAKREEERLDNADKIQTALANKVLVIGARVGEEGQLFGSVTTQQIAEKLALDMGLEIDRRKLDLQAPIKTAGEHSVTVTIYRDIKAILTVEVVSEESLIKEEAPLDEAEGVTEESAAEGAEGVEFAEEAEITEDAEAVEDAQAAEGAEDVQDAEPAETAADFIATEDASEAVIPVDEAAEAADDPAQEAVAETESPEAAEDVMIADEPTEAVKGALADVVEELVEEEAVEVVINEPEVIQAEEVASDADDTEVVTEAADDQETDEGLKEAT